MASDKPLPADDDDAGQVPSQSADGNDEDSPWAALVFGILMIAGAGWIYWYFDRLETEGGEVRMPAIAWAIYEMLGKAGLAGLVGLLGALITWSGVSGLRKRSVRDSDEST
jgi:hypothetical protein